MVTFGYRIVLPAKYWQGEKLVQEDIGAITAYFNRPTMDVLQTHRYKHEEDNVRHVYEVRVKYGWRLDNIISSLPREVIARAEERANYHACGEPACFEEVAFSTYNGDNVNIGSLMLGGKYGEGYDYCYGYCKFHCPRSSLFRLATLHVVDLDCGDCKVVSWKWRGKYYSQLLSSKTEYEDEYSSYEMPVSSPFAGPFTTRGEAESFNFEVEE